VVVPSGGGELEIEAIDEAALGIEDVDEPFVSVGPFRRRENPEPVLDSMDLGDVEHESEGRHLDTLGLRLLDGLLFGHDPLTLVSPRDDALEFPGNEAKLINTVLRGMDDIYKNPSCGRVDHVQPNPAGPLEGVPLDGVAHREFMEFLPNLEV
jgi:hypothetical protein